MYSTFNHITVGKDLSIIPPALIDYPGSQVLDDLGMDDVNMTRNALICLLFVLLFRLYASGWSYFKHTGKK